MIEKMLEWAGTRSFIYSLCTLYILSSVVAMLALRAHILIFLYSYILIFSSSHLLAG